MLVSEVPKCDHWWLFLSSQPTKREWLVHLVARLLEWLRLCHELLQEMVERTEQQQTDGAGAGQGSLIINFQVEGKSPAKVHTCLVT